MADHYTVSAKYHDEAYSSLRDLNDLPFYLEMARRIGEPLPELGCGTGRSAAHGRLQWTTKEDPHTNICRYLPKEAVDKIAQNFTANHLSDSPGWKVG